MRVAIQMDPIDSVDIDADSTFRIAREGQERGHELLYYHPDALHYLDGRVQAAMQNLTLRQVRGDHFSLSDAGMIDLAALDAVFLRQDPPFDMAYITNTHLLQRVHPDTLVVNDPAEVRNAPEKIDVLDFARFMPPTLIARDLEPIRAFRAEHGDIIFKPLYGNGGAGIFRLKPDDSNLSALHEMHCATSREPVMIQKFLPDVSAGDKRIILIDGEVAGGINRVPSEGETRSNLHVGGTPVPTELTTREREICAVLGPVLHRRCLIFVGIDVIGGYLTEINVTSPTGIQELERFDGTNAAALIWDAVERRTGAGN